MSQCPCGSNTEYPACCGIYHSGKAIPKTPEALMRSRYTAYSMANIDYIKQTMQGKPLIGFNESEAEDWAKSVQWVGLNVVNAYPDSIDEHIGFVEFIATFMEEGRVKTIHELSQFQRIQDKWFYCDGTHPTAPKPKQISRNAPCPCGSNKKYKNCHAKH